MSELRVLFVIGLIGCFASPLSADVRATPPAKINVSKVKNVPKQRIYIRCDGASEAETIAFRRRLFDLGAEKVNFFVPSLIVCEVPLAVDPAQMIDDPRFSYVEESRLDDGTATGVGEEVRRVRQSYALARALASDEVPPPAIDDFEDRVLMVPPEIVERSRRFPGSRSSEATLERSIVQNAEFLIGDVLIRLVFPESRPGGEGNE
ncbi:MAG: hypothetical protein OEN01_14175, partial [Candidatus Krumholzibacteria bacterium]|nr:hypothetical protein [Candidatus Krumholzibacteria bacterium]